MPALGVRPSSEVATPIRTVPANATAQPASKRAREALLQEHAGEHGDQDRADVDEHRGGARVDVALGLVERDVVDRRTRGRRRARDAARRARGGSGARRDGDQGAERDAADQQPAERERAGGEVVAGGADPDERRRPERHGRQRGREDEGGGAGGRCGLDGGRGHEMGDALSVTVRTSRGSVGLCQTCGGTGS